MDIGKLIRQARVNQGLSMSALARLSGVPQSSISEIEAGKRQPSFDSVERIVSALGFSPFSAFFAEEKPELEPEIHRLLDTARKLSPEQRELAQRLLEALTKS